MNSLQTSVDDGASTVGACTSHADRCGAGTGLFLRVRECKLVLLAGRGTKGCFYAPPYVDQGRGVAMELMTRADRKSQVRKCLGFSTADFCLRQQVYILQFSS